MSISEQSKKRTRPQNITTEQRKIHQPQTKASDEKGQDSSVLLQAALPLGRRLRRRLGRAVGAFGPVSRTILNEGSDPLRGGPNRIQAGRSAPGHIQCGNSSRSPDAALKGPLRRPPAALDRCSSTASPPSPVRHFEVMPTFLIAPLKWDTEAAQRGR